MTTFTKDPDAVLDYRWDWSPWLTVGDEIDTHVAEVADGSVAVDSTTADATSVTVWVSGGKAGTIARVRVRITTTEGRVDDRTADFSIQHR